MWVHRDSWLEAQIFQSWNQIQTLKDCLSCHILGVHLDTPWHRTVTAFRAVSNWIAGRYSKIFKKPNFEVVKQKSTFIWKIRGIEKEKSGGTPEFYNLGLLPTPCFINTRPGASGLPYYCAPLVCVSDVIELLAVWRHNKPKTKKKMWSKIVPQNGSRCSGHSCRRSVYCRSLLICCAVFSRQAPAAIFSFFGILISTLHQKKIACGVVYTWSKKLPAAAAQMIMIAFIITLAEIM